MLRSALCRTSYASLATRLSQINQIQQQLFVRGAPSAIQVGQQFCGTQQSRLASTSVDTSSNRRSSNESAMDFLRGSTSSLRSKSRRGGQSQDKVCLLTKDWFLMFTSQTIYCIQHAVASGFHCNICKIPRKQKRNYGFLQFLST